MKEAIDAAKPFLMTGDFGGGFQTETLDPLVIGSITAHKGVEITNLEVRGVSNFVIDKIRANIENFKVRIGLFVHLFAYLRVYECHAARDNCYTAKDIHNWQV